MLPIHKAIEQMDEEMLITLLERGANPNEHDPELGGFTALHLAVDIECEEACLRYDRGELGAHPQARLSRLLVAAGANPNLTDSSGVTPLGMAEERNHTEALTLFASLQHREQ